MCRRQNALNAVSAAAQTGVVTDDFAERLRAHLAPEAMREALVRAGALLTGYELMKDSILRRPKEFLADAWKSDGSPEASATYLSDVRALDRNEFLACVKWLQGLDAFTAEHVASIERIREHRGDVAHELARLLIDPDAEVRVDLLLELRECMVALDRFWGEIEIGINSDLDGRDVKPEDVKSGSRLLISYLLQVCGLEPST